MAKEHSLPYINFLHSPTISLQATEAGRPFHIHRDLLESKSKSISAAFERGFQEELKGVYTFQDTSEGTLARFIEWAYTGDYPAIIVPAQGPGVPAKKEESNETDKRVTACFTELSKPEDLDTQLAVIAALRLAFRKLLSDDPLLDWLAQYTAYSIEKLRVQRDFHDLLLESPELSSRIVLSLIPGQQPPWRSPPPKFTLGKYVPGMEYEDESEY
ncbi:hypothetical protein BJX68DRAFT_252410 [Aspergillus pseudodeflectus]|uniref:BTB domain-containing protein n=1 Tax=Aspergillus pseudodeflectus TaxID=176178 RepID=A0ABR4L4R2_9EURO